MICVHCQRSVEQVPLLPLHYRDGAAYICPQCLPVLIHQPGSLAGKIPGAESLRARDH